MFHQEEGRDQLLEAMWDNNTRRIWIVDTTDEADPDVDEGKIFIAVKARPGVRARLLNYLDESIAALPQPVPEPVALPAPPARPGHPSSMPGVSFCTGALALPDFLLDPPGPNSPSKEEVCLPSKQACLQVKVAPGQRMGIQLGKRKLK